MPAYTIMTEVHGGAANNEFVVVPGTDRLLPYLESEQLNGEELRAVQPVINRRWRRG